MSCATVPASASSRRNGGRGAPSLPASAGPSDDGRAASIRPQCPRRWRNRRLSAGFTRHRRDRLFDRSSLRPSALGAAAEPAVAAPGGEDHRSASDPPRHRQGRTRQLLRPILRHDPGAKRSTAWLIESRAADEAALIERKLDQGLWILETIVTAAPLLGLLGTITGMIGAFRLFGDSGAVDPAAVTGGVAEALIATAIGIVIALLALAAFNFFSHRRAIVLDEME